jgi:O-antigen ligase
MNLLPSNIQDFAYLSLVLSVPFEVVGTHYFGLEFSVARYTALLFCAVMAVSTKARFLSLPRKFLLAIPFFVVAFVHLAIAANLDYSAGSSPLLRMYVLNFIIAIATFHYFLANGTKAIFGLLLQCFLVGIISIWISLVGFSSNLSRSRAGRLSVLDMDENNLACAAGAGAIGCLIISLSKRLPLLIRIAALTTLPFSLYVMVATGSRGGILAFCIAFLFLLSALRSNHSWSPLRHILLPVAFALSSYLFLTNEVIMKRFENVLQARGEVQFSGRDYLLKQTVTIIAARPVLGWGEAAMALQLGKRTRGYGEAGTHNTFLHVIATAGLPAGTMMLYFLIAPFLTFLATRSFSIYPTILALLAFYYAAFLTLDLLHLKTFWICLAGAYAILQLKENNSKPALGAPFIKDRARYASIHRPTTNM